MFYMTLTFSDIEAELNISRISIGYFKINLEIYWAILKFLSSQNSKFGNKLSSHDPTPAHQPNVSLPFTLLGRNGVWT